MEQSRKNLQAIIDTTRRRVEIIGGADRRRHVTAIIGTIFRLRRVTEIIGAIISRRVADTDRRLLRRLKDGNSVKREVSPALTFLFPCFGGA